jgi:hypothetical protein
MHYSKRKHLAIEVTGWLGILIILGSYAALNIGIVEPKDISYILANVVGSLAIIYETYCKKDYQLVVLNVIWMGIAIFGLYRAFN